MKAIILAAGMGTRLRPLTDNKPKGLVEVDGLPMVERQIINLREVGIEEIIVVTGYLSGQFNYLSEKYGVKLIHNDKYDVYNNLYTMYLVKDYLGDSYVLESDIHMNNNVIDINIEKSTYFGCKEKDFKNEWILCADKNGRINEIRVDSSEEDVILRGISYWTKEDGEFLARKIDEAVNKEGFDNLYWDDVVKDNVSNINLNLRVLNYNDAFEIDSIKDLEKVEALIKEEKNKGINLSDNN